MVVGIWSSCLQQCVMGCGVQGQPLPPEAPRDLPVGQLQLGEVVEMLQVRCSAGRYQLQQLSLRLAGGGCTCG
jgi:hypothetical protein